MAVKTKLTLDGILEEYRAVVFDKKDPKSTFVGWGGQTSHTMFTPLHNGLTVNKGYEDKIDILT